MRSPGTLVGVAVAVASIAVFLSLVPGTTAQVGVCQIYTYPTCASILPANYSVWTNSSAQLAIQEAGVAEVQRNLAILQNIDPPCYKSFMTYACTSYLPHCSSTTGNTPEWQCVGDCLQAAKACNATFNFGGRPDQIPKCDYVPNGAPPNTPYPSTNCYALQSNNTGPVKCAAPLVPNPFNGTRTPLTCAAQGGQCCFPCPVSDLLYPTWQDPQVEQTTVGILNIVSMVLLILVLILWSGRQGVWTQSRMLTVMFSLLNALGLAAVSGFVLLTQRSAMQCASSVENSVNAPWCTFEGFMYGFLGVGFSWSEALFNINLFMSLWLLRDPIPAKACYILFPLIWLIAAILNMVPFIVSGSTYSFGTHCNPGDLRLFRNMSLLPLIAGLCVSIFLGFANVLYICKMAYDIYIRKDARYFHLGETGPKIENGGSGRTLTPEEKAMLPSFWSSGGGIKATGNARMDTFAMSWRTSLLSFTVALAFLVFIIYWFTDAEPKLLAATASGDFAQANAAWAGDWLSCLIANQPNGQNACYQIPAPYVPNYYWSYATDVMSALPGIFYFVTLGTDPNDWKRVWGWLTGGCGKGKGKGGEESFATASSGDGTASGTASEGKVAKDAGDGAAALAEGTIEPPKSEKVDELGAPAAS